MKKFTEYTKKYGIRLAIAVVIVAVAMMFTAQSGRESAGAVSNAAESISTPARKGATGIIGWLEGIYGYMFRYDSLVEENEQLKKELAETQGKLREAEASEKENENFRKLLGLRDKHKDFVFESAMLVDHGNSNWNSTFTIGKGEESGIKVGSSVIDPQYNLVGQVVEVGKGWASVKTVIDTDMRIGALAGDGGNAAIIVGDFALMQQGLTKLTYMTEGTQVFEGDMLLTSGKGGAMPRGLPIGVVEEVLTEAGGQVEYCTVKPVADINQLTQVFVIKEFDVIE